MRTKRQNKQWPSSHSFGDIDQRLLNQEPIEPDEPYIEEER